MTAPDGPADTPEWEMEMTNINVDETTRNAILAALDERARTLESRVKLWQDVIDQTTPNYLPSEDAQRAVVWNIAALHETNMARLLVAEADPAQTLAEAVPWVKADRLAAETEAEKAYGR